MKEIGAAMRDAIEQIGPSIVGAMLFVALIAWLAATIGSAISVHGDQEGEK